MFTDDDYRRFLAWCKANKVHREIERYFVWCATLPGVNLYDHAGGRWYLSPLPGVRYDLADLIREHGPALASGTLHEQWPQDCTV